MAKMSAIYSHLLRMMICPVLNRIAISFRMRISILLLFSIWNYSSGMVSFISVLKSVKNTYYPSFKPSVRRIYTLIIHFDWWTITENGQNDTGTVDTQYSFTYQIEKTTSGQWKRKFQECGHCRWFARYVHSRRSFWTSFSIIQTIYSLK